MGLSYLPMPAAVQLHWSHRQHLTWLTFGPHRLPRVLAQHCCETSGMRHCLNMLSLRAQDACCRPLYWLATSLRVNAHVASSVAGPEVAPHGLPQPLVQGHQVSA